MSWNWMTWNGVAGLSLVREPLYQKALWPQQRSYNAYVDVHFNRFVWVSTAVSCVMPPILSVFLSVQESKKLQPLDYILFVRSSCQIFTSSPSEMGNWCKPHAEAVDGAVFFICGLIMECVSRKFTYHWWIWVSRVHVV